MQQFGWGFIGCPIAIVITETLMPILLMIYVMKTDAIECWPGFTKAAFRNWGPMIRLAPTEVIAPACRVTSRLVSSRVSCFKV